MMISIIIWIEKWFTMWSGTQPATEKLLFLYDAPPHLEVMDEPIAEICIFPMQISSVSLIPLIVRQKLQEYEKHLYLIPKKKSIISSGLL